MEVAVSKDFLRNSVNVCLFNFELPLIIFIKLLNKLTTIKSILSISLVFYLSALQQQSKLIAFP